MFRDKLPGSNTLMRSDMPLKTWRVRLDSWSGVYRLDVRLLAFALAAPIVIPPFYLLLLKIPTTRYLAQTMLQENQIVELSTAAILVAAGVYGFRLAKILVRRGCPAWVPLFYFVFSLGLFITGMEEIAWGQTLLQFQTPDFWKSINVQGETTLHNISGIQEIRDHIRISFALGGGIGFLLGLTRVLRWVGSPVVLLPWLAVIAFWTMLEIVVPRSHEYYFVADSIAELTELFVAISGFLFLWLNSRRFGWEDAPEPV